MKAYLFNSEKMYCGKVNAAKSPIVRDGDSEYILPKNATFVEPELEVGKYSRWNGEEWELVSP